MARGPLIRYGRALGLMSAGAVCALVLVLAARLDTGPLIAAAHAGDRAPSAFASPSSDAISPAGTYELAGLQEKFETVAHAAAPSVVAISASLTAIEADQLLHADDVNADALAKALDRTTRTVGTGFVIDADGYILTNEHVIGEAAQIWITTDDHKVYPAIVVGSDPRADMAVLKVPAKNLRVAKFCEADVRRGQWTIALGNPYGMAAEGEMAMSVGIVSATDRSLPKLASKENRLYTNLIQTTAEINPGNSGGPLFDLAGEVIGINTAVILPQKQTNGIGFAMPITRELLDEIDELKQGHEIVYAYVGVSVSTATPRQREELSHADRELGVRVDAIEPDSPATNAFKVDDLIVSINGRPVADGEHFTRLAGRAGVGEPATFRVYRDGKPTTITVTPRKRRLPDEIVTRETQRFHWRGLIVGPVPAHWKVDASASEGKGLIVLGIDRDSPFAQRGIAQGSVITSVAGVVVSSIEQLQEILNHTSEDQCEIEFAHETPAAMAMGQ